MGQKESLIPKGILRDQPALILGLILRKIGDFLEIPFSWPSGENFSYYRQGQNQGRRKAVMDGKTGAECEGPGKENYKRLW